MTEAFDPYEPPEELSSFLITEVGIQAYYHKSAIRGIRDKDLLRLVQFKRRADQRDPLEKSKDQPTPLPRFSRRILLPFTEISPIQESEELLEITPRLLFIKWLVQEGRLIDQSVYQSPFERIIRQVYSDRLF